MAISFKITKQEGHDRIGDWTTEVKLTQDLDDGLYYYKEDLWGDDRKVSHSKINLFIYFNQSTVHS